MSVAAVKEYLKQFNMDERVLEFDASSATVELAAAALGVAGQRIAKTLSFDVGGRAVLIATAGDAKIDNHKFKEQFGVKARMLSAEQVPELVGHAVGGVCPFAVKEGVEVYLDVSMQRFATVFPACGSAHSAIELSCDEFFRCAGARSWVDVCKAWQEQPIE